MISTSPFNLPLQINQELETPSYPQISPKNNELVIFKEPSNMIDDSPIETSNYNYRNRKNVNNNYNISGSILNSINHLVENKDYELMVKGNELKRKPENLRLSESMKSFSLSKIIKDETKEFNSFGDISNIQDDMKPNNYNMKEVNSLNTLNNDIPNQKKENNEIKNIKNDSKPYREKSKSTLHMKSKGIVEIFTKKAQILELMEKKQIMSPKSVSQLLEVATIENSVLQRIQLKATKKEEEKAMKNCISISNEQMDTFYSRIKKLFSDLRIIDNKFCSSSFSGNVCEKIEEILKSLEKISNSILKEEKKLTEQKIENSKIQIEIENRKKENELFLMNIRKADLMIEEKKQKLKENKLKLKYKLLECDKLYTELCDQKKYLEKLGKNIQDKNHQEKQNTVMINLYKNKIPEKKDNPKRLDEPKSRTKLELLSNNKSNCKCKNVSTKSASKFGGTKRINLNKAHQSKENHIEYINTQRRKQASTLNEFVL